MRLGWPAQEDEVFDAVVIEVHRDERLRPRVEADSVPPGVIPVAVGRLYLTAAECKDRGEEDRHDISSIDHRAAHGSQPRGDRCARVLSPLMAMVAAELFR
jgi:hypothetical protein